MHIDKARPLEFLKNSYSRSILVTCQKLELMIIETSIYWFKMNLGSIMASLEDKGCQSLLNQGVKFVELNSLGSAQQIFTRFLEFLSIKAFFT